MITRSRQTTDRALVPTLAESLLYSCSTGACLARAGWVDFYQKTPGAFSLVRQLVDKRSPSRVIDLLGKISPCQSSDIQVFNRNQSEVIDHRSTQFVMEDRALVSQVRMGTLQKAYGLTPTMRSFLSSCDFSLSNSELPLRMFVVARVFNYRSIRECSEGAYANIKANGLIGFWQWFRFAFNRERGKPLARLSLDRQRLYFTLKRSVQLNANNADLRYAEAGALQCVSYLSKGHAVIASCGSETRESRTASFCSLKERPKRFVNSCQNRLRNFRVYYGHVRAKALNLGHLIDLVKTANRFATHLPSVPSFLQCRIVEFATNSKVIVQRYFLSRGGINPIFECSNHAPSLPNGFSF